jgi:hypothetical protein
MNKNLILKALCLFALVSFLSIWPSAVNAFSKSIAIVYDQHNACYSFAAAEIKKDGEQAGYAIVLADIANLSTVTAENRIILTVRGTNDANAFLKLIDPLPLLDAQGYSIRKKQHGTYTDWFIIGYDKTGVMYGGLDFGDLLRDKGLNSIRNLDKKPYIKNRGIKFNIPLDARTPGYSDNSDVAQSNIVNMWDISFWHRFLDDMAKSRLNMLSLWSLAPFPSMVDVPEYPKASLSDIKKTTAPLSAFQSLTGDNMSNPATLSHLITIKTLTIQDKIKFWKEVMQYADDRGVDCYLFIWNIYVYGTENSGYGFTNDVGDTKTKDYFRRATRAVITTYPLLKGIGITPGENMKANADEKEKFLFESYGLGINDALAMDTARRFRLIHRTIQSNVPAMKADFKGLNPHCALNFSYKYSQAHLYSSVKPDYIQKDNFVKSVGNSNYFFTLRDDDWYYLRGGSDPEFIRSFVKNLPGQNFNGFYMGPDGYTWGKEYISKQRDFNGQFVADKRWYCFQAWGKLAYDPTLPNSYFADQLKSRFPEVNALNLYTAWAKASQVLPLVNRFHNVGAQMDYQWYPEGCTGKTGFHNIDRFSSANPQSGEGLMSIPEYANAVQNHIAMAGTTPIQVAANLWDMSNEALGLTKDMTGNDKELLQTINDIKAMAYLGQYYSNKILGAINKCLEDKTSDPDQKLQYRTQAIKNLQDASNSWKNYAATLSKSYIPQYLTRIGKVVDISAIQADVDKDILLVTKAPVKQSTVITIAYRKGLPALELAVSKIDTALKKINIASAHIDIAKRTGAENITIISSKADIAGLPADTSIHKEGFGINDTNSIITVRSHDTTGAMYGAFELAEQISMQNGLGGIKNKISNPHLPFRAVKFNLPWSPYWQEQVTKDNYATCRDTLYWKQFLNMMAQNRFNVLTLWNLHPFTYMIRPTDFPKACSYTDAELAEWEKFWHCLFRMAKERGIETYMVNWNIFVSRGFKANYDTLATSEDQSINGKAYTSEQVKKYTKECITQTLNEYPELTGLGTSLGERMRNMSGKEIEDWIKDVYFEAIKNVKRPVKFIHRAPFDLADIKELRNALDASPLQKPAYVEIKFNHSHGMSDPLLWRSHGTSSANIINHNSPLWIPEPTSYKMTWMIRNEDVLFFRWGDPSYVRKHVAANSKTYAAGYYVGSETYIPADDIYHIKNSDHVTWKYAFQRQWLYYTTWGRLLYDPTTTDDVFANEFDWRYAGGHGKQLVEAFELASRMPLRFATLFEGTSDKTLYAEGFATHGFLDINTMIKYKPLNHNLLNIYDYVETLVARSKLPDTIATPNMVADSLEKDGNKALALVKNIPSTGTLACEMADIDAMANLSLYFSAKINGGIELQLYRMGQGVEHKNAAITYLKKAELYWSHVVTITSAHYKKSPLVHFNGNSWLWSDYTNKVKEDIRIAEKE